MEDAWRVPSRTRTLRNRRMQIVLTTENAQRTRVSLANSDSYFVHVHEKNQLRVSVR